MSHCLLVLKQCFGVEIFMTDTNIVEFYFNNIQDVNYVRFKNIQQHCFRVYTINIIPLTKCRKKTHTSPSIEDRWLGAELQVDQGILLEGTQHAAHGAAATAQREEPMGEILVIFSMGKWGT